MPPGYRVGRAKACLRFIRDLVLHVKNKYKDPLINLSGDFNQWPAESAIEDYPDLVENEGGNTRKNRRIDKCFSNFHDRVISTTILPPLETEATDSGVVRRSDHKVVLMCAAIEKLRAPNWRKITFRPYDSNREKEFKDWADNFDWQDVILANGSNEKARRLQAILDDAMNRFFPTKTIRRKEDDLPWLNDTAVKKIKKKKAVFKDEGRSERWKAIARDSENYLERRRLKFVAKERKKFIGSAATKNFHKNVKSFNSAEKPKEFDVRSLKPGCTDKEVAEDVAKYFNQISTEFDPLDPFQIPRTYSRLLPALTPGQVAVKLRSCKKTSMVDGDIFPSLVTLCSDSLAIPLCDIFNTITSTFVWPIAWKKEIVTVIPKKNIPQSYADLRNISCTKLFSKVYEGCLLTWIKEEIELKPNQFGGTKGCSTAHMLITIMNEICENCEDYRSGTVLTAIDYSKAFNRVSFQHCLKAFKKKGASSEVIRLIATFLTNRTMVVKVGDARSDPLPVNGGCPQGSILGVLLFNVTTEDLEDEVCPPPISPAEPDSDSCSEAEPSSSPPSRGQTTSTPTSGGQNLDSSISPLGGGRYRVKDMEVVFEAGTRNLPAIEYSDEGLVTPPKETKTGTQVLIEKGVIVLKYVDDNITIEKLNYGSVPAIDINGTLIKERLAPLSQNAFRSITRRANDKGMIVNSRKTQMLVVSDSLTYTPRAYVEDRDGVRIGSSDSMKVLGFNFSNKPTMHAHVASVLGSVRRKYWGLRHLRKIGFNQSELTEVYKTHIRPTVEYLDVVYHSLLTDEQDEKLENAQLGALRAIFDHKLSGRKLREAARVETLRTRREQHCDKFAARCVENPRFSAWFPKNQGRSARANTEQYQEKFARCDRLKNSPLFYMRRRLNGKQGKHYGERNRQFREA